jgi:dienelactone hydrolase
MVRCEEAKGEHGDWLIRFPSAVPTGNDVNDLVAMEWYMATDASGHPVKAPAVVVVHESGRSMIAGRAIARGLRFIGVHTFLIHLPGYGERASPGGRDFAKMLPAMRQAVADVRRARDAVAVLPLVDADNISLEGTSLGGFVTATVAGLDRGYSKVFILLAGGQIADVLLHGKRDAARIRERLEDAGLTEEQIRALVATVEPTRLAHRVDPARTWLFTGRYDDVVPPACSDAFATAAGLKDEHRFTLPAGHYTTALLLPLILPKMGDLLRTPVK